MKTIKQLEKEIEEIIKEANSNGWKTGRHISNYISKWKYQSYLSALGKLYQTKATKKMIEDLEGAEFFTDIDSTEDYPNNIQGVDYNMKKDGKWLNREELLSKIEGSEKNGN